MNKSIKALSLALSVLFILPLSGCKKKTENKVTPDVIKQENKVIESATGAYNLFGDIKINLISKKNDKDNFPITYRVNIDYDNGTTAKSSPYSHGLIKYSYNESDWEKLTEFYTDDTVYYWNLSAFTSYKYGEKELKELTNRLPYAFVNDDLLYVNKEIPEKRITDKTEYLNQISGLIKDLFPRFSLDKLVESKAIKATQNKETNEMTFKATMESFKPVFKDMISDYSVDMEIEEGKTTPILSVDEKTKEILKKYKLSEDNTIVTLLVNYINSLLPSVMFEEKEDCGIPLPEIFGENLIIQDFDVTVIKNINADAKIAKYDIEGTVKISDRTYEINGYLELTNIDSFKKEIPQFVSDNEKYNNYLAERKAREYQEKIDKGEITTISQEELQADVEKMLEELKKTHPELFTAPAQEDTADTTTIQKTEVVEDKTKENTTKSPLTELQKETTAKNGG